MFRLERTGVRENSVKEWYCWINNQVEGPFSDESLRQAISNGSLITDTLVWNKDLPNDGNSWQRAVDTEINLLFEHIEQSSSQDDVTTVNGWYCILNGQAKELSSEDEIKAMIKNEELTKDTLVWNSSSTKTRNCWAKASDTELAVIFQLNAAQGEYFSQAGKSPDKKTEDNHCATQPIAEVSNAVSLDKRTQWSLEEAVLFVDAYPQWEAKVGGEKVDYVRALSGKFRKMATKKGYNVSEKYRNENGIKLQLFALQAIFTDKKNWLRPPKVFFEAYDLYKNNREEYDVILDKARFESAGSSREIISNEETPGVKTDDVLISQSSGKKADAFFRWLIDKKGLSKITARIYVLNVMKSDEIAAECAVDCRNFYQIDDYLDFEREINVLIIKTSLK
jgi:hypothetical protein